MNTVGWRSPLGGPRYDGDIPGEQSRDRDLVDEWPEDRIQDQIDELERARATCGPEPRGKGSEVADD